MVNGLWARVKLTKWMLMSIIAFAYSQFAHAKKTHSILKYFLPLFFLLLHLNTFFSIIFDRFPSADLCSFRAFSCSSCKNSFMVLLSIARPNPLIQQWKKTQDESEKNAIKIDEIDWGWDKWLQQTNMQNNRVECATSGISSLSALIHRQFCCLEETFFPSCYLRSTWYVFNLHWVLNETLK